MAYSFKHLALAGFISMSTVYAHAGASCADRGWVNGSSPNGPDFVVLNERNKYSSYKVLDWTSSLDFYSSEDGFISREEYNSFSGGKWYAEAEVVFNNSANYGRAWVATEDDVGLTCRNIFVQWRPTLSGSYSGGIAKLSYSVSAWSKAIQKSVGSKVTVYARTETGGTTQTVVGEKQVTGEKGTVEISPSGFRSDQGTVYFSAIINDGVYNGSRIQLGTYRKACPTGSVSYYQTSPGNGGATNPCGTDAYGKTCPYTTTPTSTQSYPVLKYTCQ